ncbi:uncharacterized protein LOC115762880 [Drosophila novamexicana]|uniref:uncharacterized protein LOC115762880 n=1 Tax=Drosophila novamexicana TaxID=47314 RepID=UPI0011E6021C|nr:uncharacterized protein LOC115762880 [Drosophila novamexicana]
MRANNNGQPNGNPAAALSHNSLNFCRQPTIATGYGLRATGNGHPFYRLQCIVAHVTFTNLKCNFTDRQIGNFQHCHIKAVNRTHKYVSVHANIYTKPLNNVSINIRCMRYNSGYKPFFFDVTFDACKFLKQPRHPILILFYNTLKNRSNMNHTCPYNHDIIVDKLYTGDHELEFARYLPVPMGDYAIYVIFYVYKVKACTVNLYLRITN